MFKISGSSLLGFTVFLVPSEGQFDKQYLPKGREFDRIFKKKKISRGSACPPQGPGNN